MIITGFVTMSCVAIDLDSPCRTGSDIIIYNIIPFAPVAP